MNTKTQSKSSVVLWIAMIVLLLLLALGSFLATSLRVVMISGSDESFVLKPYQFRMGILYIDDNATAIFREKSHWLGPVISDQGKLTVENDVTITGPIILANESLLLRENTTVQGSVFLFNGSLTIEQGASVRHNVVLFNGCVTQAQNTSIRGNVVLFNGGLALQDKASVRGDTLLFNGYLWLGQEAIVYGESIVFMGEMKLAPKAVLRNDAVLLYGNVYLSPEALVRGDMFVVKGDANLDGQSKISGKLYLNSDAERLHKSPEAQITRGVIRPVNIESTADWRVAAYFIGHFAKLLILPAVAFFVLLVLIFFVGRYSRSRKMNMYHPAQNIDAVASNP